MLDLQTIMNELCVAEISHNCIQGDTIYVKPNVYAMSTKKLNALKNIANIQRYYQCNPVRFISDFFNIELLDVQAWIVQRAWNCPNVLIVATRGLGKSTIIDLMLMAKGMLFNNYWAYICSGSGQQAQQTFTTLERLANDDIDEMIGSTGYIFKNEVEIKNAAGDGFSHSPSEGFSYSLYNGSKVQTLNSNIDKKRGFRGNVIFDEASFLSVDMLKTYGAFAIVNKSFKTGKNSDGTSIDGITLRTLPLSLPNQKFYMSSASSTDMEYYRLYREFAKRQLIGDPDYFVAQIDCEIAFHPTIKGSQIAPLLTPSMVETEMRTNPEKARREYYCEFTTEAGADAIIRRGVITRNEQVRKPLLYNDTGDKKFIIAYDPARQRDNSVILVAEVYDSPLPDGSMEKKSRLVNCVNLMDVGKKIKSPMQTPDQIEYLKQLIVDYNGGADGYGNIIGVYIDAGSGGGGVNIADFLMQDWTDKVGITHRGLIDKQYSADYVKRFPNAVDKLHLMSPTGYKSIMFEALIEMLNQDKISFTSTYDGKDYLTVFDINENKMQEERKKITEKFKKEGITGDELEVKVNEELGRVNAVNSKNIKLEWRDKIALRNMDALKEELVSIVRKKRDSGKDSFDLSPEKASRINDDRAYVTAMVGYGLMELRRKAILKKPKADSTNLLDKLTIRRGRTR